MSKPDKSAAQKLRIGVLALQGDFDAHKKLLEKLGADVCCVRKPSQLNDIQGLVIPGGESTTLLKLMQYVPQWWPSLQSFKDRGGAFFGTCAGMILLAREVTAPAQRSLGFIDLAVERNAYGRQKESFEALGSWADGRSLEMVFIRAPRIAKTGPHVEVLASHNGVPVFVREGRVFASSFHPEINKTEELHGVFLASMSSS
jgi:pyridoxal 5'-phosphate synthase pdxT subunit